MMSGFAGSTSLMKAATFSGICEIYDPEQHNPQLLHQLHQIALLLLQENNKEEYASVIRFYKVSRIWDRRLSRVLAVLQAYQPSGEHGLDIVHLH